MGTSPPKQKAVLSVTLRASMVATAASAAVPPPLRTARPASTASCPPAATAPWVPVAFQVPARSCAQVGDGTLPRRAVVRKHAKRRGELEGIIAATPGVQWVFL